MRALSIIVLLFSFLLQYPQETYAWGKKKQKKTEAAKESKYDKLLKKNGCVTSRGKWMALHKADGKLYLELSPAMLGRDMLLASTLSSASDHLICEVGSKQADPLHVRFEKIDSLIFLKKVNTKSTYNEKEPGMQLARSRSFTDPVLKKFPVYTYNNDSSSIVFEVTDLLARHNDLLPVLPAKYGGVITIKAAANKEGELLREIKAFEDNIIVKTDLAYKVTMNVFGLLTIRKDDPVSVLVTRTLLLLPEEPMQPRISDSRIGIFLTDKQHLTTEEDQIRMYSMIHRWRIEPRDSQAYVRGELSEPVKPIVFYIDNAFPELWKAPLKEGILRWNKAFEKIGFKNVLQVSDFPEDDPGFDPDNLKYSCVRYLPSTTANAMGPSWVDPRSGEIINASVLIYHNVIRLINQWRFIQTAQIDPRVRNKKMPDDVVKESIAYVVAHETGHCLGFMHNMAASSAYPVDSLRSVRFTSECGTTPSIMDYARFNYIAQPGDTGVKLTPPDLGIYDDFLVKWAYQPIAQARSAWEEIAALEQWLDEHAGDARFRYGRQQLLERYDPGSIEEDLGDDPLKAGEYGIANLKYILSHLDEWITGDGDASHKEQLMEQMTEQYFRYVNNVLYEVGGIYLTDVKDGTPGQRFQAVPREKQQAALKWVIGQFRTCDWLYDKQLSRKMNMKVNEAYTVRAQIARALLASYQRVVLSAHLADEPYTLKEYFEDVYQGIWKNTIAGKELSEGEKMLQTQSVSMINDVVGNSMKKKGKFFLTSLTEMKCYGLDETGMIERYYDELRKLEQEKGEGYIAGQFMLDGLGKGYNWQDEVDTEDIDNSRLYIFTMANRVKKLLEAKIPVSRGELQEHYRLLLFALNRALDGK